MIAIEKSPVPVIREERGNGISPTIHQILIDIRQRIVLLQKVNVTKVGNNHYGHAKEHLDQPLEDRIEQKDAKQEQGKSKKRMTENPFDYRFHSPPYCFSPDFRTTKNLWDLPLGKRFSDSFFQRQRRNETTMAQFSLQVLHVSQQEADNGLSSFPLL